MPLILNTRQYTCPYATYCWKSDTCTDNTKYDKEPECYMPVEYEMKGEENDKARKE
jgi:hypothetical protein